MSYEVYLPNGAYYTVPDKVPRDVAEAQVRKLHPELYVEPPSSALGTAAKSGIKALLPTLTGAGGFESGALAFSPLGPVGSIVGGIGGGLLGSYLGSKAQDTALSAMPDTTKKLGLDEESMARDAKAHPIAAGLGEFAPAAATFGLANPLRGVSQALTGAGINAGLDLGQQLVSGQPVDYGNLAKSAAEGAVLKGENPNYRSWFKGKPKAEPVVEPKPTAAPTPAPDVEQKKNYPALPPAAIPNLVTPREEIATKLLPAPAPPADFTVDSRGVASRPGEPAGLLPAPVTHDSAGVVGTPDSVGLLPAPVTPDFVANKTGVVGTPEDMQRLSKPTDLVANSAGEVGKPNEIARSPVTDESGQTEFSPSIFGESGKYIPGNALPDEAYEKAAKMIAEEGVATVKRIKEVTGLKSPEVTELLQQMERDGLVTKPDGANRRKPTQRIFDFNDAVEEKANADTGNVQAGRTNAGRNSDSPQVPTRPMPAARPETPAPSGRGLANSERPTVLPDAGAPNSRAALVPAEPVTTQPKSTAKIPDRPVRPEVEALRQKANDMFENDEIPPNRKLSPEDVYDEVNSELKKPFPDLSKVKKLLGIKDEPVTVKKTPEPAPTPAPAPVAPKQKIIPTNIKEAVAAIAKMRVKKELVSTEGVDPRYTKAVASITNSIAKMRANKARVSTEEGGPRYISEDGPFTGKQGQVVGTKGIDPRYTAYVHELLKSVGLGDLRVLLGHHEDLAYGEEEYSLSNHYNRPVTANVLLDIPRSALGATQAFGPKNNDHFISLRSDLSEGVAIETLAHEVGHIIQRRLFDTAPKETRAAVLDEYAQWFEKMKPLPAKEQINSVRNREVAEETNKNVSDDTKLNPSYWGSFNEWFADNVSRWATTEAKPVSIVEKFFKNLADKLRQLLQSVTGNRFVPANSVKEFLNNAGKAEVSPNLKAEGPQLSRGPTPEELKGTGTGTANEAAEKIEASKSPDETLEEIGAAPLHFPEFNEGLKNKGLNAISSLYGSLKDAVHSIFSINQLYQMYKDKLPTLGALDSLINRRGAEMLARKSAISNDLNKWVHTIKKEGKYSKAQLNEWHEIAMRSTLDQIEILDSKGAKPSPLKDRFDALPQGLKDIYSHLRDRYDTASQEYVDNLTSGLNVDAAAKLRASFESSRMKIYMPLFRRGNYWISYTDKLGNEIRSAFESPREREMAEALAKQSGASNVRTYRNLREMRQGAPPPAGFMSDIVSALKAKGVTDENVYDDVYSTFLDYYPATSLRQRFKTRLGRLGMEPDLLQAYANVGSSMQSMLNNMKHAAGLDKAMEALTAEAGQHEANDQIASVMKNVNSQMEFLRNPRISNLASKLGTFSYSWYLAGNASSAFINMTHLPMVVMPLLQGRYGMTANKAIWDATKAFKIRGENLVPEGYKELFDHAYSHGALGQHIGQELFDLRKTNVSDYTGLAANIKSKLDFMFHTADRSNREITLMATYDLALKANKGDTAAAMRDAVQMVKDAYGSSLSEAGPRILQNNIARVAFTFKRFAMNRAFILGRVFNDVFRGDTPEVRAVARRQLLGIYGMAYAFSGVAGMPLVGAAQFLANQCMGEEDHPYDAEAESRIAMGDLSYKGPINYMLNLDVSNRTGWNDMLWKDDPRRLAEVGAVDYIMERAMGPAYSTAIQFGQGYDHFQKGEYDRMMESWTPAAIRNVMKASRYASEGVQTAGGEEIGEVSGLGIMAQAMGFAPADIAERRAEASAMTLRQKQILSKRQALLDQMLASELHGGDEGDRIRDSVDRFNDAYPGERIKPSEITNLLKSHNKKEVTAIYGVNLKKGLRDQLMAEQGLTD